MEGESILRRDDSRIIIHFDYDCFYASVVENETPVLKSLPLAIQQKHIIVTCNYEARRRGLYKLQLIREARRVCPDVIIVLGEDLTRFRNASKDLYNFLRASIWSGKAERLGFDEVFLDCTDMIEYNLELLNQNHLADSFFCLDRNDPTIGFAYDATRIYGPVYPADSSVLDEPSISSSSPPFLNQTDSLPLKLLVGSHLAKYLRHKLEQQKGYTATVGICTNKLLSKLVGNVNKPKNQTTLIPPYQSTPERESNVTRFVDAHDIGKVPGIGFKLAQKIRARVLGSSPILDRGLVYPGIKESVTVRDVRLFPGMGPEMLEDILAGPGSQKGIGGKVWGLFNGVDPSDVGKAKSVPSQISIEDSYLRLDTFEELKKELIMLAGSLIRRIHADLSEQDPDATEEVCDTSARKWLAHARTLRLSTRPRPPLNPDGTRSRTFKRISRSGPMPSFVFTFNQNVETLAERLVDEALLPAFKQLHSERSGWNLSLVNVAATNMTETAADSKDSSGRDIGRMFRKQDDILKEWRVVDEDEATDDVEFVEAAEEPSQPERAFHRGRNALEEDTWDTKEDMSASAKRCPLCGADVPVFAHVAHNRYHSMV